MKKSLITSNSDLPHFYHLVKTHKLNTGIKIRPIISNCNGPTKKMAWLLSYITKPMLKDVTAHLENSMDLISMIQSRNTADNLKHPYPFSLDVVSLYTSIPVQEAMRNVVERLEHNVGFLARDDIEQLLTVTLSNTYFTFESNIYCQVKGLPMGSSISGILAMLFMDRLEKQALTLYQPQIVDHINATLMMPICKL